jgi:serine/threonine protein kinase
MTAAGSVSRSNAAAAELADLVERLTARVKAGDAVDLDDLARAHPDHAEQLRRLLPAMKVLADLSAAAEAGSDRLAEGGLPLAEPLGDFRLIREVGRGGMGVVYEAEQLSLGRRVALKVLPFAATMDSRQLQRFRNEAKAAASLHHEHVVPVYGVGCERGVHYYAMQFIDGQTLAQMISSMASGGRKPPENETADFAPGALAPGSPVRDTAPVAALSTQRGGPNKRESHRRAAELIADAADALEYAHSMGIVHRDVKPGNLMVDGSGKLWVADFGLARFGPDAGLTMTGDLLGTLRYMAPEQALAKHGLADHRVDVYGLGCTLYELLTGKPAVAGTDKADIVRRIAFEEPIAPRKLDKAIPAELETIALKCLAKTPIERYATAGELAADLRRWAQDKPIEAKRPSMRQRIAKWARRHSGAVWAAAAGLVLVAAAAVANAVFVSHKNRQTEAAYGQVREAYGAARRALDGSRKGIRPGHRAVSTTSGRIPGRGSIPVCDGQRPLRPRHGCRTSQPNRGCGIGVRAGDRVG